MARSMLKKSKSSTQSWVSASTGGALSLSAFASFVGFCCIGPWSVTVFGVSGAVALAGFEPYRPYILAVALVFLSFGFWNVYWRKTVCVGTACSNRSTKLVKVLLWLATAFMLLAFFAGELQSLIANPADNIPFLDNH